MKNPLKFIARLCVITSLFFGNLSHAQSWKESTTLLPAQHEPFNDWFGSSISVQGNVMVIGAPNNSDLFGASGKAVVFEQQAGKWNKTAELIPDKYSDGGNFGNTVVVFGDLIFVSAPGLTSATGENAGAVHVFKKESSGWKHLQTIAPSDPVANQGFGVSIAARGSILAIGAPGRMAGDPVYGGAYIYNFDGISYQFVKKISRAFGTNLERFGAAVEITDDQILVGTPYWNPNDENYGYGGVFVYSRSTYDSLGMVVPNTSITRTQAFGSTIKFSGTALAVAAKETVNADQSYGAVTLYKPSNGNGLFQLDTVFTSPNGDQTFGLFGESLVLNDTALAIGGLSGTKAAVYTKTSQGAWANGALAAIFTYGQGGSLDYQKQFGRALGLSSLNLVVGAPNLADGKVFVFDCPGGDWNKSLLVDSIALQSMNAGGDHFGSAIDIDGDYAVVSDQGNALGGWMPGVVYLFKHTGQSWSRVATLSASNKSTENAFGLRVGISKDVVVVSAPNESPAQNTYGAVYVFEKPSGDWHDMTETRKLLSPVPFVKGYFGADVAVAGTTIGVTILDWNDGSSIGRALIYEKKSGDWLLSATLSPTDTTDAYFYRRFGQGIKMTDNVVAVSTSDAFDLSGAIYMFEKPASGWADAKTNVVLTPSDPVSFSGFGQSFDLIDSVVIVGCVDPIHTIGRAYLFDRSTDHWATATESVKISEAEPGFGECVAITSDFAFVGAKDDDGTVYYYTRVGGVWSPSSVGNLTTSKEVYYSHMMAINENYLLVGSQNANTDIGGSSGKVQVFERVGVVTPPVTGVITEIATFAYPNPFDERILIAQDAGLVSYTLINEQGMEVVKAPYWKSGIDTHTLSRGLYILKLDYVSHTKRVKMVKK